MASIVNICNMAVAHIGDDTIVTSITPPDGSYTSGLCAKFYDVARSEMLEAGDWRFSLTRVALAETTNPSQIWQYAYALPSDCLRARRIPLPAPVSPLQVTQNYDLFAAYPSADLIRSFQNESDSATFHIGGRVLLTNQAEAELIYTKDVTDSGLFSPTFASALSYLIASYLAGPVIKGQEGTRIGDAMRQKAMAMAKQSAAVDANAGHETSAYLPDHLRKRM